jgi:hypothetical protein
MSDKAIRLANDILDGEDSGLKELDLAEHLIEQGWNMSEYNGWKNYETWAVFTWLSNDQDTYNHAVEIVRQEDADETPYPNVKLREFVEELFWGDETPANLQTDLLMNALDDVDWDAVVRAFRDG